MLASIFTEKKGGIAIQMPTSVLATTTRATRLSAQLALDPGRRIVSVAVEVVEVVLNDERTWTLKGADWVGLVTVVADHAGEHVHARELVWVARVVGVVGRSVEHVIGLVRNVARVTEQGNSSNLVTRGGGWGESWRVANDALLHTERSSTTTENVSNDVGSL